jgi:type I restriction enzyme S subunit
MNTPKIRFKGFTDDWEQRKLGDSCKLNGRIGFRGYTEKDIVTKEIGGVLTFSPTNIVDNKLTMECKNTYITREKYDESPEIKIFNGDILFVKTGSTLGKSALVTGLKEDASINPQIVVMRVEKDKETFMSNVLITDGIKKQVTAVKIGGAVPTMTETELKNIKYYEPVEKEEQKRIGQYFEHLDHLITLHQRKCDETKQLKKFMLQKMFPKNGEKNPEIRFEGFTDDWEQRKVSDLLQERNEQAPRSEEYPLMAFIADQGVAPKGERYDRSALVNDENGKKYKRTEYGDFIYSSNNLETGSIGLNKYGNASISPVYSIFKRTSNVDLDFLGRRFLRKDFINEMVKWRQGVVYGQWKIHESDFLKINVVVPSIEEQKRIGHCFEKLDYLITLHQRKCEKLKELKKYMLQNMFV